MPSISLPVIDQLGTALSATALRHRVIVGNIAQRDSEGYRRLAVHFDQAWAATPGSGARGAATIVPEPHGAAVSLERDLVSMSSNALNHQALARSLGAYFSLIGAAIDGRRA